MLRHRLTLRTKLNLLSILNGLIGLTLVAVGFAYILVQSEFQQKGEQALDIAEMVAAMPQVVDAFGESNPSAVIQPFTKRLQAQLGTQFIVVANMQLIRYSHPDIQQIGKRMDEQDHDDTAVLKGQTSITQAVGTLGLSIRGKAPIVNQAGQQIGFVSVGFLVNDVWKKIGLLLLEVVGIGMGGLIVSTIGSHWLSGHVKRQIFGMEPNEIAYLVKEQMAILQSIREGILAVNSDRQITACNEEAQRMLNVPSEHLIGRLLTEIIPYERLCSVIVDGPNFTDQPMVIGNTLIVANRVPVRLKNQEIGAVITFRDKLQLDHMEQRLQDIERYSDDLRSQRHEFMNHLHTISGLIHLKEYNMVCELIDNINSEQNHLLSFFAQKIRDPAVLGLIIGKIHRAKEIGVQIEVDSDSYVSEMCTHREVVVTVLGNAVDNAIEALQMTPQDELPKVGISIHESPDKVHLSVKDTGPGIDPVLGDKIFEDGVTTKGAGRGLGLSICAQMVAAVNGHLSIRSSSQGAVFQMTLPRGENIEAV